MVTPLDIRSILRPGVMLEAILALARATDSGSFAARFASACGSGLRVGLLEMLAVTCAASGQASGRQVYTPVLLLKKLLRPAHFAGSGFLMVTRVVPWAAADEAASGARRMAHRPIIRVRARAPRFGNPRSGTAEFMERARRSVRAGGRCGRAGLRAEPASS